MAFLLEDEGQGIIDIQNLLFSSLQPLVSVALKIRNQDMEDISGCGFYVLLVDLGCPVLCSCFC